MKIIIPMSGVGKRFQEKGYENPKYLLNVFKKPVIKHILSLFPGEKDINLIMNEEDYKDSKIMSSLNKIENLNIHCIKKHKKGPGYALLVSGLLETEEEVFINYCDFANIWNWSEVKKYIKEKNPDGLLPAYKGLHLHTIYGSKYAFIKESNKNVISIKEKEPFTDNPREEYASTGGYYFSSGLQAKKYIEDLFSSNNLINGEAYISSPYDLMIQDGLKVDVYNIDYFFQWGTPEDYEEFIYCMNETKNIESTVKINLNDVHLILPVAGEGKRFKDVGYSVPKVLLDVHNEPMIKKIVDKFSNQETTHILGNKEIEESLLKIFHKEVKCNISITDKTTKGQAESALILIEKINDDKPIFVQSGDSILGYFDLNLIKHSDPDMVVFTKKNYRRALTHPKNFGWVLSENNVIKKTKIKDIPDDENYSMILGSFFFKNRKIYELLYKDIKNNNLKELHIDYMINAATKRGLAVLEFAIDDTAVIGTPIEYELNKYSKKVYEWFDSK